MYSKQMRLAAICAASAILLPVAAIGQTQTGVFDRSDNTPADEQPNLAKDPVPLPVGIFLVQPSLDFSAGYTSNLFATESNEEGSSFVGFAPKFDVSSQWQRHGLGGALEVDHLENTDNTSESRTNVLIGIDGWLDLSPGSRVYGEFFSEDLNEDRTEIASIAGALDPNEFSRLSGSVGLAHESNRWQVLADFDYATYDHDDSELPGDLFQDQDFRDRDEHGARVRLARAVDTNWAAYAEARRVQADFDPPGFFNAFNRDYEGNILSVGSDFSFGDTVTGDIGVGFMSYTFNDPFFADIEDVSIAGNVQWALADNTTLETELSRGVIDPGLIETIAAVETGVNVRLAHGLTPSVFLIGEAGLNNYEFENIDRSDDRVDVLVGANWKLNKNIWLESNYELRNSSSPIQEFSENRVLFRMRVFP